MGDLEPNVNIQPVAHGVSQQQTAVDNDNNNQVLPKSLYVGDLDPNVNEAEMYDLFCQIGQVLTVYICRDAITNNSLGHGYVYYNSGENAREALRGLNSTPINGNPIRIMYSPHDPIIRSFGSAKIFVSNLDKRVGEYTFYRTFATCGPILCSNIKTDASRKSKRYGFVIYEHRPKCNKIFGWSVYLRGKGLCRPIHEKEAARTRKW